MGILKEHWPIILFAVGAVTAFTQIQADVSRIDRDVKAILPIQERFYKLEEKVENIRNELTASRFESREYKSDIMEGILEVKKLLVEKKR